MNNPVIYISEYFDILVSLQTRDSFSIRERYRQLYELLDLFSRQLLSDKGKNYPNLFARIGAISEGNSKVRTALNTVRIHAQETLNRELLSEDEEQLIQNDIRLMAFAIGELCHKQIPIHFLPIPFPTQSETIFLPEQVIKKIRATFIGFDSSGQLLVIPHNSADNTPVSVTLHSFKEEKEKPFSGTLKALQPGMQLNFIQVTSDENRNSYSADIIIIEPDILLDISAVAECFKEYGAHPLNYLLNRLSIDKNTRYILLGNIANFFLDELVNEKAEHPVNYFDVMQKAFRQNPFGIAACPDLQDEKSNREFFSDCKRQFDNLCHIVRNELSLFGISKEKALLEPSFICEVLGLQGRLDFLCDDLSAFIELKSGKGKEIQIGKLSTYSENHYVQMLLYFAVLHFNLNISYNKIKAYLLYSRYPQLYPMTVLKALIKKAINLRNEIVAQEYLLQAHNSPEYSQSVLFHISSQELNQKKINSPFWEKYLRKPIDNFAYQIKTLPTIDNLYFMSIFTFITKEQYVTKAGEIYYDSTRGLSTLWNVSPIEKRESGEMITGLILKESTLTESGQYLSFCRIISSGNSTEPNFRKGDIVILYRYHSDKDNACNQQIFKAYIESITSEHLLLIMRICQRNSHVLPVNEQYAIERDYLDVGFTSMYRGLAYFLQANDDRRSLLLGKRRPRIREKKYLNLLQSGETDIDRIVAKALSAQDYFLLVGPPGTGKTSHALKKIVESYLQESESNILLIAYTHKAVDEICNSLISISPDLPFIRLGNEISCDKIFHKHLLDKILITCQRRSDVLEILNHHRIFVSTLTTLNARMDLFKLKHFDVAIIDEASQILEPHLLGLLCCIDSNGNNAIGKFILIGDHKQLPAIVTQNQELSEVKTPELRNIGLYNLRESLFERLYRYEKTIEPNSLFIDKLTRQGRMHPEIGNFPAKTFYGGELYPIPLPHQQEKSLPYIPEAEPQIQKILSHRIAFISISGKNKISSYKTNVNEAQWAARISAVIYHRITKKESFVPEKHLGIITPYRSQIATIKKELGNTGITELLSVTIDTVERFQGGQRDVMIFSCCVNTPFQLQFLCNTFEENGQLIDRKLNVALTRAREQMIVIGNPLWLERDTIYRQLIEYIKNKGAFFQI